MLVNCWASLLLFCLFTARLLSEIHDPYKLECVTRKIHCHARAICQQDELTSDFYCQCLPGYRGDGINSCQDPGFHITASNASACSGFGEQVCLLKVTEEKVTFRVSVSAYGKRHSHVVRWYKYYSGQSPHFNSYRRRVAPVQNMSSRIVVADHGHALTLLSILEDDFYPNLFWAEVKLHLPPTQSAPVEPYELSSFQMLNPSKLRYFFALQSVPVEIGEFLEGDPVTIRLSRYLQLPPSSFVRWIQEPRPMTLLDSHAVVLANDIEEIEIRGLTKTDFGFIRALVYNSSPGVPGRVLISQRLFLIKKDISKNCSGSRYEKNCRCTPGFEGNGVHCLDINECEKGMPVTCLPEAECVNTHGSYFCRCPKGLEGDGLFSCIDVDECATGLDGCGRGATCLNTLGSFFCMCRDGFVGDGLRCEADGRWSEWSPWSACSATCSGVKKRIRLCDSPAPARGGLPCEGEQDEVAVCDDSQCPVDGTWSSWEPWTPCPSSCGLGVESRSRQCSSPTPKHGGRGCHGHGYEERSCGFPEAFCKYLAQPSESSKPGKLIQ
ncbi:uncharacterized protein LOC123031045 isoform X2 [Varanus komodoensis]|uniref:uncharacterized protein LOC123031045 isoform X2 n=1 Tax=Varanus komodoensis TaxID=61221 RepID=UPI001CF7B249|nr:uncharacterized protein LOC123031045 isoform X2 [Varanus komodoensis]